MVEILNNEIIVWSLGLVSSMVVAGIIAVFKFGIDTKKDIAVIKTRQTNTEADVSIATQAALLHAKTLAALAPMFDNVSKEMNKVSPEIQRIKERLAILETKYKLMHPNDKEIGE